MSESQFFVRSRGRITGPFDIAALHKLVQRGMLQKLDELSADRMNWSPAQQNHDLFAPEPIQERPVAHAAVQRAPVQRKTHYYRQGANVFGPVSVAELRTMASNGTLRPKDLVWAHGANQSFFAIEFPPLIEMFQEAANRQMPQSADSNVNPKIKRTRAANAATITGIIVGALLLLLLNLPWFVIEGNVSWWWSVFSVASSEKPAFLIVVIFYYLLSGIALCILTPLIRGIGRGAAFVGIGAIGFLIYFFGAITTSEPGAMFTLYLALMQLPVTAAALAMVSITRAGAPNPSAQGRIIQTIFGGLTALFGLIGFILLLIRSDGTGPAPQMIVLTQVFLYISQFVAIAAGALAIVCVKPTFTRGLNLAAIIVSSSAIFLTFIATIILFAAIAPMVTFQFTFAMKDNIQSQVMLFLFRFLLLVYATLALFSIGLRELLVCFYSGRDTADRNPV